VSDVRKKPLRDEWKTGSKKPLPHNDHAAKSSIRTGCEHAVKKKGGKLYGSRDVLVVDRYVYKVGRSRSPPREREELG